ARVPSRAEPPPPPPPPLPPGPAPSPTCAPAVQNPPSL
ncbi:PREDICTED: acrosin-like, partial [Merops nubicus]